jgi:hypothetical protein
MLAVLVSPNLQVSSVASTLFYAIWCAPYTPKQAGPALQLAWDPLPSLRTMPCTTLFFITLACQLRLLLCMACRNLFSGFLIPLPQIPVRLLCAH